MKRFFLWFLLLFVFLSLHFKYSVPAQQLLDSPENAAMNFAASLGRAEFDLSYRMLADHAKKTLINKAIERFSDIDCKYYFPNEMDYLLQTNIEGHRTVIFEDLTAAWCNRAGIKPGDLTGASVKIESQTTDRADLKITVDGHSLSLTMKKEAGQWKAAWYPYE